VEVVEKADLPVPTERLAFVFKPDILVVEAIQRWLLKCKFEEILLDIIYDEGQVADAWYDEVGRIDRGIRAGRQVRRIDRDTYWH
jgi:hypothetical protein